MKTTNIDPRTFPDAPVPGAKKIWWLVDGHWVHKGWLMPQVNTELRYCD